jgi:hypothetical protein
VSTSIFTATGAAYELRYLHLGAGRPVVLVHPLRMQLEYFQPLGLTPPQPFRDDVVIRLG